eukprot:14205305-Heterocapsa_arctica.AAC.1
MAPAQDNTEGFAITEEKRKTQLKLNRMRKYQMLVNKKQENQEEGKTLHYNNLKEISLCNICMR